MRIGCSGQAAALQVISAETYATGPRASGGEASNSFQPEDTLVFPCFSFFPRPLPPFLPFLLPGVYFETRPPVQIQSSQDYGRTPSRLVYAELHERYASTLARGDSLPVPAALSPLKFGNSPAKEWFPLVSTMPSPPPFAFPSLHPSTGTNTSS